MGTHAYREKNKSTGQERQLTVPESVYMRKSRKHTSINKSLTNASSHVMNPLLHNVDPWTNHVTFIKDV